MNAPKRRIVYWPLWASVLFPAALVLVWSGSFGLPFIGAPLVLLSWGVAALVACAWTVRLFVRRERGLALFASVLPVTAILCALNLGAVWTGAMELGEQLHFRAMRSHYLAKVSRLPSSPGPRIAIFDWGGFGVSHAVVYDDSDEITLPKEKRSPQWNAKANGTELECGVWGTPLGGHFYLVRMGC